MKRMSLNISGKNADKARQIILEIFSIFHFLFSREPFNQPCKWVQTHKHYHRYKVKKRIYLAQLYKKNLATLA